MKEAVPNTENYDEMSEYLGNLNFRLPGSRFRENALKSPISKKQIKELEFTRQMQDLKGDIFSDRFLNTTVEKFHKDNDRALRKAGFGRRDVLEYRRRLRAALDVEDRGEIKKVNHQFLKLQLKVHDELIEMGYNHYEVTA